MSAEKRIQNWILVAVVLVLAIAIPLWKVSRDEPAVRYGIDLVGGVDLLLEAHLPDEEGVDPQGAIRGAMDIMRNRLDPEGIKEIIIQQMGDDRIVVQIPGEDDPEWVKRMIGTTAMLRFIDAGRDAIPAGTRVRYIDAETGEPVGGAVREEEEGTEEEIVEESESELPVNVILSEQVLFTGENIIDITLGVDESGEGDQPPAVSVVLELQAQPSGMELAVHTAQHQDEYLALLIDDRIAAIHEITQSLTVHRIPFSGLTDDPDFDLAQLSRQLPNMKIVYMEERPEIGSTVEIWDPMSGQAPTEEEAEDEEGPPAIVDVSTDQIILTGDDFADADVTFDQVGRPTIAFRFKPGGREIFGTHTATHVQQFLAIALDDMIISCPVIQEPILRGDGVISGSFTLEEAQELVIKLDSGRLPVPLEVIENRTVGPTLGAKSIDDSMKAGLLGAVLILLFMALYYRLPGLMADIALLFYVVVFYGTLSLLNATLTLPGIAGFILSVGMAVDANVIIFERLKEELKTGKTFRSATEAAFKRAFLAIFDANVTTLITALVLYNLGTGPIRGFAVTLSLGILVSMFSALVFTRLLIEAVLSVKNLQKYALFGIREKDVALSGTGGDAR